MYKQLFWIVIGELELMITFALLFCTAYMPLFACG